MALEYFEFRKKVKKIPVRICVTGTRGKSTITRLIASALKEAGFRVLARTTGSKPVIICPDGSEEEIERRGLPSILEGKKILKLSDNLKIDALVLEMMSITPECGYIESIQMFKPHILVITNVRLDHVAQMGNSKKEIANCYASYISSGSKVFILEEEFYEIFHYKTKKMGAELIRVPKFYCKKIESLKSSIFEFEENLSLALAITDFLGIKREIALRGMTKAKPDFGHLKIWIVNLKLFPFCCYAVNCFAVNDPESTKKTILALNKIKLLNGKKIIGILNLRKDRGDRTLQWLEALSKGMFSEFEKFYLIGEHSRVLKRKLKFLKKQIFILKTKNADEIMKKIFENEREDFVLIGLCNIGGIGIEIVNYWEKTGEPYVF